MFRSAPRSPEVCGEVAVVLPCYNAQRHLQRALDSAFAQTFQNFHVYGVNDGSSDHTAQILQSNSNADRCSFVSQSRSGAAAARNRAICLSGSPFVAFLDADDEWLPRKLEQQMALLKQDESLGMVCSGCASVEEGDVKPAKFDSYGSPVSGKLFDRLVRKCFVFTPTVVVRRRCLEEVGLFNESLRVSEDFNLWLRIAARWPIAYIPEALSITYKHSESLSARIPAEERLRNGVAALQDVQDTCPSLSLGERYALRIALAERHYFLGSYLLASGIRANSRSSFFTTLRLKPAHWKALVKLGLSFLSANSETRPLNGRTACRPPHPERL